MYKTTSVEYLPYKNSARGHPVLYLDFDGVLHPDEVYITKQGIELRASGHRLFEGATLLQEIMTPFPEVKIVLSTSWVPMKGFLFAKRQLPDPLARRVLGATFHRRVMNKVEFMNTDRGLQIASDVMRRQSEGWLALDDDDSGWPSRWAEKLVFCRSNLGLLHDKVAQGVLEGMLANACREFSLGNRKQDRVT